MHWSPDCTNKRRPKAMATVLVVDDDSDFVRVTSKVLRASGHQVLTASNGAKALQVMRQDRPDVVLLDIMMSYILDGLDVSREMAQDPELKGIPVIMVTSLTGVKDAGLLPTDEYVPVDEWLTKPVEPEVLARRVNEVLR
jgi:chemosensory pili system protein ChpA (sensor histidine kinase/response regulator)